MNATKEMELKQKLVLIVKNYNSAALLCIFRVSLHVIRWLRKVLSHHYTYHSMIYYTNE